MASFQEFDKEVFLECIKDLVRVDRDWVPKAKDTSLYVRPAFIGTEVRHVHRGDREGGRGEWVGGPRRWGQGSGGEGGERGEGGGGGGEGPELREGEGREEGESDDTRRMISGWGGGGGGEEGKERKGRGVVM